MKKIILFIDGLSFDHSRALTSISNFKKNKITPGAGFSNNIYTELICGRKPDEAGFFNEWTYSSSNQSIINKLLLPFDLLRGNIYINYAFRFFLKKLNLNTFNIPFKFLHLFKSNGAHNFESLISPNFPKDDHFTFYDSALIKKSVGDRDLSIMDKVLKSSSNKIFISLVDLDNIAHIYGTNSSQYHQHINLIDHFIKKISNKNQLVIFSDHGMVDVKKIVTFQIESLLGKASTNSYTYFLDSTFLRVWLHNKNLKTEMVNKLKTLDHGLVIDDEERKEYSFINRDFGDIIFRANESVMYVPNFFGFRSCKAMHGYDPKLESQKAFLAHNFNTDFPVACSSDVYHFLKKVFN